MKIKGQKNPWVWQSWSQLNNASELPAEFCKHRIGGDKITQILKQKGKYNIIESTKIWWDKTQAKNIKRKMYFIQKLI